MHDTSDSELFALQEALVGRYSIQREIGRGGMGIVYLAHDVSLDRPVALKLLPPTMAAQPALRERFIREARTAAKLSQPNIVAIHAVEEVDDFVFFVMAYVDGETLGERIRARGPLPPAEATRVLREVAWALAYAHARGVVHRDVKPDNILLEAETRRALVMDFGIAQVSEGPGLTNVGEVLGTAEYMSPEQASGTEVDERSDIYSMGVLGHLVLSGQLPFQGQTVAATLAQHLTRPAPPLGTVVPEAPLQLAQTIDRCLAKDPADRFADGEKLAEALSRTLEERRVAPVPLRSFIEQSMERFQGIWGWLFFGGYFTVFGISMLVAGIWEAAAMGGVMGISLGLAPFAGLSRMTRALLRSGYDNQDLVRALDSHLQARREERALEIGANATWVDRVGRKLIYGGLLTMALGTLLAASISPMSDVVGGTIGIVTFGGFLVSLIGMPIAAASLGHGRRIPGERWLKFWKSRLGRWMFKFSGIGLKPTLGAGASYRPTEMLIGTAADRLFDGLPKATRKELPGLPEAIRKLEEDAQRMRKQVDELNALLAEIGDDPDRVGADERARLKSDLESTRDEAQRRMTEAVSALETIRLGLLRLHAGEGSVESLTLELGSAQEVSTRIEQLLAGQEEVARLLDKGSA